MLRTASYLGVYQYENVYAREAAQKLAEVAGADSFGRVMFSTSGGAANDLAIKIVRHYHAVRDERRRNGIVAMNGCWHGLTYGAFALTSDELGQRLYGVDRRLVLHVDPNDPGRIRELMESNGDRIGAVIVEPVLGTGAVPLTDAYVGTLLDLRRQYGFLLIADEVATGFGRTGTYFATHRWPEPPDILISAKGLTNGTSAAAAVVLSRAVAETFDRVGAVIGHGETQAGTAVSCAAMLATIEEMERLDAVSRGAALSLQLDEQLARIAAEEPMVRTVTGRGCFRSIRLLASDGTPLPAEQVRDVVAAIRDAGALVHGAPDGIQLLPALVYTDDELSELFDRVRAGLRNYAREHSRRGAPA